MQERKTRTKSQLPLELATGNELIQVFGLSEGSILKLKKLAHKIDVNLSHREYAKNILREYAYNNLKVPGEFTLRQKMERLRDSFDTSMSLSEYCRNIILMHLKASEV